MRIRLDRLVLDPSLPDRIAEDDWIDELAESLKSGGQVEAITVRPPIRMGGPHRVIHGRVRWAAARRAGLDTLYARVLPWADDREAGYTLLVANQSRPLAAIEKGWLIAETVRRERDQEGVGAQRRVAARLISSNEKASESTITRYVRIGMVFSQAWLGKEEIDPRRLLRVSLRRLLEAANHRKEEDRRFAIKVLAGLESAPPECPDPAKQVSAGNDPMSRKGVFEEQDTEDGVVISLCPPLDQRWSTEDLRSFVRTFRPLLAEAEARLEAAGVEEGASQTPALGVS